VSRSQRLTFLAVAAAIAVVAVVVLLIAGGGSDDEQEASATATPTATATSAPDADATETPTPTATATPKPQPPLVTPGKITDLRFKQGETVRFRVRADTTDEVHVHGYDLMKDITPGETISFSFPASITGIFEVELENAGEQIAQLRVDPD
jgi:FtsP/CotA-like multicopper oxidase with cupredoxin domain